MLFVASAFALHAVPDMFEYQPSIVKSKKAMITLGGQIRIRGEIADNNSDFRDTDNGNYDDDKAAYDQRVRLSMKATVSPNTLGFVELETGDSSSDDYKWGHSYDGSGVYNNGGNYKPAEFWIRQAYIAHQGKGLLGMLAGFKAGHMLLGLGNGLFYDHTKFGDDALVFWMDPADNTEVALAIVKLREQTAVAASADDVDAYVLTASTGMNGINISGDITYLNDNSNTGGKAASGGTFGKGLNFWNIGLRADTDMQGVNIYGDVEFQTGKAEAYKSNGDDMDLSGWALLIGANAKVADLKVGAEFAYGSGDDIDSENDYEGFITSIGSGQHYTYLYDQKARTASQSLSTATTASSAYANTTNTGLNNTWYIKVGASTNVNPDVKVSGDVYYLRASEKVSNATDMDKKDIGVEVDGKVTYQIDSNFVYYVEAGYLFAGDFYANVTQDKSNIEARHRPQVLNYLTYGNSKGVPLPGTPFFLPFAISNTS
jgi:hypothetical protein